MRRPRPISEYLHVFAMAVIVLLIGVSLVSQGNADWYSGDNFYNAQVIWFLVGGLAFILVAMVDLRLLERLSYVLYGLCVFGLILTAFVGTEVNHSQRWLRFMGMNLQVSEITKLGVIIALSRFFNDRGERAADTAESSDGPMSMRHLVTPAFLVALPCSLILIQPDLGTAMVIGFVALSMMLYHGIQRRTAMVLVLVTLVGVPTAWQYGGLREYQKDRVRLWVNPDWFKFDQDTGTVVTGRNLQSEQAIWAIGSGKFWGRGSREGSRSRLKYLPEMHTDMIIATFAEEQGFLGCTLLLGLFWFLILWGLRTAKDARDTFCAQFAVGITAMLGWQVFINVGMVAGLLPIVGLPLPFLSYGGSAAVTLMLGLGLLFNVGLKRGRL